MGFKTVLGRDMSGCVEVDERVIAALEAASALVFTAGIGEQDPALRAAVSAGLDRLGVVLDADANQRALGTEAVISAPDSPVKVLVIPTNEELVVAREVQRYLLTRPLAA